MEKYAPNIARLPNEPVSELTKYSACIITVSVIAIFAFKQYVFDLMVVRTMPLYRETEKRLDTKHWRKFTKHNIGAAIKIVLIFCALYPFMAVEFGSSTFQTPVSAAFARPTMGDMWVIAMQVFQAMFAYELFQSDHIGWLSTLHHLGTMSLGQAALTLTFDNEREPDAIQELGLCFVWGAFDVVGQLTIHIVMIVYRLYHTRHQFIVRMFHAAAVWEVVSALFETAVIMWMYGAMWDRWTPSNKIITPIFHTVFKAAQIHGARVFMQMARKEKKRMQESMQAQDGDLADPGTSHISTVQEELGEADHVETRTKTEVCETKVGEVKLGTTPMRAIWRTSGSSTVLEDAYHEEV